MGRFKNVEVKGLLIENFGETFYSSLQKAIKSRNISEEEAIKKLTPKLQKLFEDYEHTISALYVEKHKFNLDNFLKTSFNWQRRTAEAHKDSFTAFILYLNVSINIYERIIKKLGRKKLDNTLRMTVALYGLILRRTDQILHLLLSGYIDGAMIVWRSLYENAITLLVLAHENDPDLADKYYKHSLRNQRKKMVSYDKNYKELRFPAIPKTWSDNLNTQVENIKTRYGKDFLENEYGWADGLFDGKKKANFMLLEERAGLSIFRPYYIQCCEQIHSNFNSFNNFMIGSKVILPKLLSQETQLVGFVDPMQFTTAVLHEVNDYILYEFSTEEEQNVNLLLMRKIFEKQQKTFDIPKRKRGKKA